MVVGAGVTEWVEAGSVMVVGAGVGQRGVVKEAGSKRGGQRGGVK